MENQKEDVLVSDHQREADFAGDCLERVVRARCDDLVHEIRKLCANSPRYRTKVWLPKKHYTALQAEAAVRRWSSEVERRVAECESEDGLRTHVEWVRWFIECDEGEHYVYRVLAGMELPESEDEGIFSWYGDAAEGAGLDILGRKASVSVTSVISNYSVYNEVQKFVERSGLTQLDLGWPATWH